MGVAIKFIKSGANSVVGGFSTGDIARVDAAFAKHLVEGAGVAKYLGANEATKEAVDVAEKPVKKSKK